MNNVIVFFNRLPFFNHLFDIFNIRPHWETPAFLKPTKDQEQQVLNLAQLLLKMKELQDQKDIVKPQNASLGHPTMERSEEGNYSLVWKSETQSLAVLYRDGDASLLFSYASDDGERGVGGMESGTYTALHYVWKINNKN